MRALAILVVACSSPATRPPPTIGTPPPRPKAVEVVAGEYHTCARLADRTVWCWGNDESGQLGRPDDGTRNHPKPIEVVAARGARRIVTGDETTCAIRERGEVSCWGKAPTLPFGDAYLVDLAFARFEKAVCAIVLDGHARCLREGKLVDIPVVADAIEIAVGMDQACARGRDGTVWCWPDQAYHPLEAADVWIAMTHATSISVGPGRACATRDDGTVQCWWGPNTSTYIDGALVTDRTAKAVEGIAAAAEVRVGGSETCVRTRGGAVQCWGRDDPKPYEIDRASATSSLAVSWDGGHACVIVDGDVRCWGDDDSYGQLGRTPFVEHALATPLPGLRDVESIVAGAGHTCAMLRGGEVKCWGDEPYSSERTLPVPTAMPELANARQLALGYHSCMVRSDRTLACWGSNERGELGDGTETPHREPMTVAGLTDVAEVEVGINNTCARTASGSLWCWGHNLDGQVGDGTKIDRLVPVEIAKLPDATGMIVDNGVCVLRANAPVACFGPLAEHFPDAWKLTARALHYRGEGCALLADASISCIGSNRNGGLGNGTLARSIDAPVRALVDDVVDFDGACAVKRDGSLWCWGPRHPSLGLGVTTVRECNAGDPWEPCIRTPTRVPIAGVARVVATYDARCALMRDRTVRCWGGTASETGWGDVPRTVARPIEW